MPTPDKPTLDYSYSAFQQAQGNNTFPGTQLDNDLANLKQAIDETIDFTSAVIRSDGALADGVVPKSALAEDVLLGIAPPRAWVTGTAYAVDDTVFVSNTLYICVVAHTAGTFNADLSAARWQAFATFAPLTIISDNTVSTSKIVDAAVTTAKIADNAVTTAKIPDAAITQAKLAPVVSAALLPVGASLEWDGPLAPAGWLFKFGQALSRVTYSALLNALTVPMTVNVANGGATITGLLLDLRNLGLEGSAVEGPGIPVGATVVSFTATTMTISVNATASGPTTPIRLFPHGNGDGSTTFTVPDDRDNAAVGRGNMGGVAAARVSTSGAGASSLNTARLGGLGGVDRHAISIAELASHNHGGLTTPVDPLDLYPLYSAVQVNQNAPVATPALAVTNAERNISHAHGITSQGGGAAHQNVQPSRVVNKIIYTGVI